MSILQKLLTAHFKCAPPGQKQNLLKPHLEQRTNNKGVCDSYWTFLVFFDAFINAWLIPTWADRVWQGSKSCRLYILVKV